MNLLIRSQMLYPIELRARKDINDDFALTTDQKLLASNPLPGARCHSGDNTGSNSGQARGRVYKKSAKLYSVFY